MNIYSCADLHVTAAGREVWQFLRAHWLDLGLSQTSARKEMAPLDPSHCEPRTYLF